MAYLPCTSVVQAVGDLLARGWLLVDNASTVVLFIVKRPRVTHC